MDKNEKEWKQFFFYENKFFYDYNENEDIHLPAYENDDGIIFIILF